MAETWYAEPAHSGGVFLVCRYGGGKDEIARKFVAPQASPDDQAFALVMTARQMKRAISVRRCGSHG